MQNEKKRWLLVSAGCLVASLCMVGTGVFLREKEAPPVRLNPPLLQEKKPTASVPVPSPEKEKQSPSVGTAQDSPLLAQSGVVRRLTNLQAQFEERKLEVAIAKESQKLQELLAPPAPYVVQAAPQQIAPVLPDLPDLTGISGTQAFKPQAARRKNPPFYVVSIQGLEGNLTAMVATPSGQQTVRVGDSVGGKRVANISVNGVTLKAGGRSETLAFKE